ncbi:MAG: hypothetical protein SFU99_09125, partial [Saprospiraceae bacterium]|nr:hypothetical protein [Saprospiraceae bacterium]
MGIIQRQGIKDSIVTYIGVGLGAVNALFIYPYCLRNGELGLFQFLLSWAMIITPFVSLGSSNLVVRYFPTFRNDEKQHHGFLFLMLILTIIGFLLFTLLAPLAKDILPNLLVKEGEQSYYSNFTFYIVPLTLFIALNTLFINYIKNFLRIVIPTFLDIVFVKIGTGLISIFLFWGLINLVEF